MGSWSIKVGGTGIGDIFTVPEVGALIEDRKELYHCYNLSYLLLSYTKYKYTVYIGMYFPQNTSYQTPTTTQW